MAIDPDLDSFPWEGESNHTWITVGLDEDSDGDGDIFGLNINKIPAGTYSIWGMIYDGFNNEVFSKASGHITILGFNVDRESIAVPEGGTASFQVRLNAAPSTPVSVSVSRISGDSDITIQSGSNLTFSAANWNVYQAVTLAAAEDVDTGNGTAAILVSGSGIPDKNITAAESDNDTLAFNVDRESIAVPEGGTASFQVRLNAAPSTPVSVSVSRISGDSDITIQSGSNLTFSAANWNVYQAVTLAAAEDVDTGNGTAAILVSGSGIPDKNITAAESDNDTLAFNVDRESIAVPEGGTASFQVRLNAAPSTPVSVSVSRISGDSDITIQSGTNLTFSAANWNVYQAVTLAAAEDVDTGNGTAAILVSGSGIPDKNITAAESDNDTLAFNVDRESIAVPEGGTASFQVRLNAAPSTPVSVSVSRISGDSDITIQSGTNLTFSAANWNVYQAVTLAAAEDVDTGNGTAAILVSGSGIPDKNITAAESDNDTLAFNVDRESIAVPEGGTASFQVRLNAAPSTPVSVSVSRISGDSDITIQSGTNLTFSAANWNVYQAVTLAAAEDVDTGNGTAAILVSGSGIPDKNITAAESDNDTLAFNVDRESIAVPEGGTASFQVRLNAAPSTPVSVSVSRISGDSDITIQSGTNLTFSAANWNVYQAVTLAAAEDVDTGNGTAAILVSGSGIPDKNITAAESDNDTLAFNVDRESIAVPEGGTASFQVRLNAAPSTPVSVSVSRISGDSDITIQSGSNLTFSAANWNVYQAVTLAAAEDVDTGNGTAAILVSGSGIPDKNITAAESDNDLILIWYVDGDVAISGNGKSWDEAFRSLKEALTAALEGHEIWVAEGTYIPGLDRSDNFELKPGVAVYGGFNGTETSLDQRNIRSNVTILSGDITGNDVGFVNNEENVYHVIIGSPNAILDGFTITGGNANGIYPDDSGGGVFALYNSPLFISNCIISTNSASWGGGLWNNGLTTIKNCLIVNNRASRGGGLVNIAPLEIFNSTTTNNEAYNYGGAIYNEGAPISVKNCIFWNNVSPTANEIYNREDIIYVRFSNISGGTDGILNEFGGDVLDNGGNIDVDPQFFDPDGNDNIIGNADDNFHLSYGSPCINSGTNDGLTSDGTTDIGATIAVTVGLTDWAGRPCNFSSIQGAIDDVNNAELGGSVLVSSGIYYENPTIYPNIDLIGAGIDYSIIDGGGFGDVIRAQGSNVISGFTIKNCGTTGPDTGIDLGTNILVKENKLIDVRSGIWIHGKDNIIKNNIITVDIDTGIVIGDFYSGAPTLYPLIENNTIDGYLRSGSTGILAISFTSTHIPIIKNNIISNFRTSGIYAFNHPDYRTIRYNCFWNNNQNFDGLENQIGSNGNIENDPLFMDQESYDFSLDINSPCIDSGDPLSDFSNEPEPNGGRINIGAYGGTDHATQTFDICHCDFLPKDGDVDGLDLAAYLIDNGGIGLSLFAQSFGRMDCP